MGSLEHGGLASMYIYARIMAAKQLIGRNRDSRGRKKVGNTMALSKEEVRQMVIDWLNENKGAYGSDTGYLMKEFIEKENICPELVIEIMEDMAKENFKLNDGRVIIPYRTYIFLPEELNNKLRAHRTFHTGGVRCPEI